MKSEILRKKYPKFIYRSYNYKIAGGNLEISFFFEIPPDVIFRPKLTIKSVPTPDVGILDNLVFHIGLIEMLSYWKATCSPEIIIEAGYLNKEQISWWKNLIIKGMGQFFYENKIDWRRLNFLKITSKNLTKRNLMRRSLVRFDYKLKNRYLVPFAGGRDSIVTLEKLKAPAFTKASAGKKNKEIALFTVNPVPKIQKAAKVSGIKKQIIVERTIDKKLLELNKKGYLNGHTPFTSLLSFISVLCAVLFDYRNIVFSLEKSANEGNVRYLGRIINHQWAKSSEFEKMFKNYCRKYLIKNLNYFSYLRRYGELEISKTLTKYPQYFPVFSSCNAGTKIGKRWCGNCPKCLFVYMSLCPYLKEEQLLKIFGKNLLQDKKLLPTLKALMGQGKHKPFECVGTYAEAKKAYNLCLNNLKIKKY